MVLCQMEVEDRSVIVLGYKLSRFNVLFKKDNKFFISNTFTHSLIELEESEYEGMMKKDLSLFSKEYVDVFVGEGICVDSELDELGLLRYAYDLAKNNSDYMEFVVAPTLDCNFACPYCFETKRHHFMEKDIQQSILDFYLEQVRLSKFKKVKFAWYGGEPLLQFDIIRNMTKQVNEINEKNNVTCDVVMTTNGYLLTEEIVYELERLGFKYIQITIDGPKEIHDNRRMLVSGIGTFDKIIENIKLFKGSKVEVSVRINVDKENAAMYLEVSRLINSFNMSNVRCYPALVEFTPNQESCRECKCMTAAEFSKFASTEAREYYYEKGGLNCGNISVNCGAEHIYSFVIDDYGDVYKCWNSVGYENERLFNLKDRNNLNPIILSKYLGRDPFSEKECSKCAYLPICGGGCAYDFLFKGTHTCVPEKFLYEDIITKEVYGDEGC